jgi:hypothetical protein
LTKPSKFWKRTESKNRLSDLSSVATAQIAWANANRFTSKSPFPAMGPIGEGSEKRIGKEDRKRGSEKRIGKGVRNEWHCRLL